MKIFIDTSAWDTIEDSNDRNHELALIFKDDLQDDCLLIITDYVLDETDTLLLMNIGYELTMVFQQNIRNLITAGILGVIHVSSFQEAADAKSKMRQGVGCDPGFHTYMPHKMVGNTPKVTLQDETIKATG